MQAKPFVTGGPKDKNTMSGANAAIAGVAAAVAALAIAGGIFLTKDKGEGIKPSFHHLTCLLQAIYPIGSQV